MKEHKVKHIAMESTGVYWVPVWNVLEQVPYRFELLVVNPQQVRADAAILRALAATDADLVLVGPDDLDVGVAALLRYADASTRHR